MIIPINIQSIPDDQQYLLYKFLKNKFEIPKVAEVLSLELQDLYERREIKRRTFYQLRSLRINTIHDLANYQRSMFYGVRWIGPKSLIDIESILHRYGLQFAKE